jgi:hypothetical protein
MLNLNIGVIVVPIKYVRVPRYNPDCLLLKEVVLLLRCVDFRVFCLLFFTGNGFSSLTTHASSSSTVETQRAKNQYVFHA